MPNRMDTLRHDPRDIPGSYRKKTHLRKLIEKGGRGTIKRLAKYCGVDRNVPSGWMDGRYYLTNANAIKCARFFDTNVLYVLDITGDESRALQYRPHDPWRAQTIREGIEDFREALLKCEYPYHYIGEDDLGNTIPAVHYLTDIWTDPDGLRLKFADIEWGTESQHPELKTNEELLEKLNSIEGDFRDIPSLLSDLIHYYCELDHNASAMDSLTSAILQTGASVNLALESLSEAPLDMEIEER